MRSNKRRTKFTSYNKYIIAGLIVLGLILTAAIIRFTDFATSKGSKGILKAIEKINIAHEMIDHAQLAPKGLFFTAKEGMRVDLMQRDANGKAVLAVQGAGDEQWPDDSLDEFVKPTNNIFDGTVLIASPDNTKAVFFRSKYGSNEIFAVDSRQNLVYRITDKSFIDISSSALSAKDNSYDQRIGWLDGYLIYFTDLSRQSIQWGATELVSFDLANKVMTKLDSSTPDTSAGYFSSEKWYAKLCSDKIVYTKSWDIFYKKEPEKADPNRNGYMISVDANGKKRKILKTVDHLSGVLQPECT